MEQTKNTTTFDGRVQDKVAITSVYLEKFVDGSIHKFFCSDCRNAVCQYQGEVVSIVPGLAPSSLPLLVQCSNEKCRRKYQFISFVEVE